MKRQPVANAIFKSLKETKVVVVIELASENDNMKASDLYLFVF